MNKAQNGGKNNTRRKLPEALKKHVWKPGQSGNPGGRPRKGIMSDEYEKLMQEVCAFDPEGRTYARLAAEALAKQALKGKVAAMVEITDRIEGKAVQRTDLTLNSPEDDPKEKILEYLTRLRTRLQSNSG